jgi:membrane-bound metal-dependent hydrolase YbcI (DUF457 family)
VKQVDGRVHKSVALSAVGLVAALRFPQMTLFNVTLFPLVGLATFKTGAIWADVDLEGTTEGRKHPLLAKMFTHRGFTHTGFMLALVCLTFYVLNVLGVSILAKVLSSVVLGIVIGAMVTEILVMKMEHDHHKLGKLLAAKSGLFVMIGVSIGSFFVLGILPDNISLIVLEVINSLIGGFVLAYASHIIADGFNGKGVPLFWPIIKNKVHVMSVVTGTYQEYVFLFVWVSVLLFHVACIYAGWIVV